MGSVQFPGLDGDWYPRTYPSSYPGNGGQHYAQTTNLSVNGHVEAVVPFKVGEDIPLEDIEGHHIDLRLIEANAEFFLMQYRRR